MPGGDIFGFTSPSDVGSPGEKGLAFETSTRVGKRGGTYISPTLKTQLSTMLAPNLAVALSTFTTGHHIQGVPGLEDRSKLQFDVLSGEVSYRFVERTPAHPLAATLSVEPRWARLDGVTGERVAAYGAEAKLFIDTVLVPERLYGALNLTYAFGSQRLAADDPVWTQSSGTTLSGAWSYQISERLFAGLEARHLTAFSGAVLDRLEGHAMFVGPHLLVMLSGRAAFNVAWTPQVVGRSRGVPRSHDLDNFERHQLRAKLAISF
jgi:hypothetical protein